MPPPKDETAEQREARLIKARKKASNVREEKMIEKYKNKVLEKVKTEKEENVNVNEDEDNESENENENVKPVKEIIPKPMPVKEPKEIIPKAPKKKQSKVIIEQSSDDDDVFEDKPNVIFVKRVRPKPKINEPQPVQQPSQQPSQQQLQQLQQQRELQQQQRPPQPPPQRPAITPEKRLQMQQYINMSQGHFLPVCRPR